MVSAGNGLPTVCLKSSDNDRDQLIAASARKTPTRRLTHSDRRPALRSQLLYIFNCRAPMMDISPAKAGRRSVKLLCSMVKRKKEMGRNRLQKI